MANAVYWVGGDGNIYLKSASGVKNVGSATDNKQNYNLSDYGFESNTQQQSIQADRIADPNPQVKGASNTTGGAADTTGADLGYLDDQEGQLRQMLSSTDSSLNNGITQLDDSLNKELQKNTQGRVDAKANYGTKREDTTKDMLGERGSVNTNARTLSDSVRRVLGMASGNASSAYQFAAPGAIARDTSIKSGKVKDAYSRNNRNIDNAETDTMKQFDLSDDDLRETRKTKESDLRGGILQQQQGIFADLADIARERAAIQGGGYAAVRRASAAPQAEIASRQGQLDSLFSKFRTPFAAKAVTPTEANLDTYNQEKTNLATQGAGNGAASGEESPFLQALRKRFQTAG